MIEAFNLNHEFLKLISKEVRRDQLPYHEYKFLETQQLKEYFINKVSPTAVIKDHFSLVAVNGSKLLGFISAAKDEFDSENFGFACFRVTSLLIFTSEPNVAKITISGLINELERKIIELYRPVYFSFSLNNNVNDQDIIFNSLTGLKYHYIHTLLTFGSKGERFEQLKSKELVIRKVNIADAEAIAKLAQKSFSYSRFHLDPHLDNQKANILLSKSAINSVLEGFVDVMFVAEIKGEIAGYYSAKKKYIQEFDLVIGDAVISAVGSEYQGKGIFSELDSHLLNWFSDNVNIAEMGTYLINFPVHRTWINKGLGLIRGIHQFSKFID